MTADEFKDWWADFGFRYPTVVNWLRADNEPNKPHVLTMMLRSWAEVLGDVALPDALEVNRRMQSGDLEDWGKNSDRIPATVRRHARAIAWQKSADTGLLDDADAPLPPRGPNGLRFGDMQRYVELAIDQHLPPEIWKAEALRRLGDVPQHREPRYKCFRCRDTGFVHVFTQAAIAAFKAGTLDRFKSPRLAVVGCVCRNVREWILTFDDAKFCAVKDGGGSDRDLLALEKFVEVGALGGTFEFYNQQGGHVG